MKFLDPPTVVAQVATRSSLLHTRKYGAILGNSTMVLSSYASGIGHTQLRNRNSNNNNNNNNNKMLHNQKTPKIFTT